LHLQLLPLRPPLLLLLLLQQIIFVCWLAGTCAGTGSYSSCIVITTATSVAPAMTPCQALSQNVAYLLQTALIDIATTLQAVWL